MPIYGDKKTFPNRAGGKASAPAQTPRTSRPAPAAPTPPPVTGGGARTKMTGRGTPAPYRGPKR